MIENEYSRLKEGARHREEMRRSKLPEAGRRDRIFKIPELGQKEENTQSKDVVRREYI